jgi:hypothetical protein
VLHQGGRSLTCGLLANETGGYDVCVMPHWNLDAFTIEEFDGSHAALAGAQS